MIYRKDRDSHYLSTQSHDTFHAERVLFRFLKKPHHHLLKTNSTYQRWHRHPLAHATHVVLLAFFLIFKLSVLTYSLVPQPAAAASNTWTTTADFASWTHTSTQEINDSIQLTASGDNISLKPAATTYLGPGAYDPSSKKAYLFGAVDESDKTVDQTVEYNATSDTYTAKTGTVNLSYVSAAWSTSTSKAYIFGGEQRSATCATPTPTNTIREYNPSGDSVSIKSATFPTARAETAAIYDPNNSKIYIFGGRQETVGGGCTRSYTPYNQIFEYNPATDTLTQKSATLPTAMWGVFGAWDPVTSRIIIFGGVDSGLSEHNQIYAYDPGSDTLTAKSTMTTALYGSNAIYDTSRNRIFIFGGHSPGGENSGIFRYNPSTDSMNTQPSTQAAILSGAGFWNATTGNAFVFVGSPIDGLQFQAAEYDPTTSYAPSGHATKVYTPSAGTSVDWTSASYNTTLNGQTVSLQYTTNTNCSTGLTGDITSLSNSESLCLRVNLSTSNTSVTPSLDDITVNYSTGSGGSSTTPTPTPASGGNASGTATPRPGSTSSTGSATPAPSITTEEACLVSIKNLQVSSNHQEATLTYTSTASTKASVYYYLQSKTTPAGSETKNASKYTVDSTKVEETTATKSHSLSLKDLTPSTTYYYTVLNGTAQECEHSFITQAPPPTPTPEVAALLSPSPGFQCDRTTTQCLPLSASDTSQRKPSLLTWISDFLTSGHGFPPALVWLVLVSLLIPLTFGGPTFSTLTNIFTSIANWPNWWFNLLSWRKRKYQWGRVVSSLTLTGINNAQVVLYDLTKYNRVIDRAITQKDGQFGFLVPPGTYGLRISRAGYSFPSHLRHDGYHGTPFKISQEQTIQLDAPVDPIQIKLLAWQRLEALCLKLELIRLPLLGIGTVLTIINLIGAISLLNLLFLAYYTNLWIWELRRNRETRQLLTVKTANGTPVPFAVVRLLNKEGHVLLTKATDSQGKAFILTKQGSYTLSITPPSGATTFAPVTKQVILEKGYLVQPLVFEV